MVTSGAKRRGRSRDSEATKERILDAAGRLLARRGFLGLGVNAVAREARVDKVLIYRYFGGLPELLEAFAERSDFWPTAEEAAGASAGVTERRSAAESSAAMLKGLLRGLRSRRTTQEVLRWELAASNELTEKLAEVRERRGLEMLRRATRDADAPPGTDLAAVAAVLSAGLVYLVLRSRSATEWLGVPLSDEKGWARIERAVETIVARVMAPADGEGRRR